MTQEGAEARTRRGGKARRPGWTLRFADPRQEAAFRRDYFHQSLHQVRVSLLVGGFLYAVFGLLDARIVPDATTVTWIIRYAVVCPLIAAVLALSYTRCFERCVEPAMALVGLVGSWGIVAMIAAAAPPGSYLYYAGLLLAATFVYTFMRLRFVPATFVNLATLVLYESVALDAAATPPAILLNNSFFLVSINVVGMSACYYMEHYARTDFLRRMLIRDQAGRLETALAQVERARREAEEQSRRDALTGLFNRRHFRDILAVELERARRSPSPVSLILMDVDRFKRINDTCGHATGDEVLRRVAQCVGRGLRRPDTACRYGGEEFALLLPGSDGHAARHVAERVRAAVAAVTVGHPGGPAAVTASLGVATMPAGESWDADILVDRADRALYAAKRAGRDRVCVWEGGEAMPA